jgi:Ser/Thr protein kinase RdoA (MazF antagonist)
LAGPVTSESTTEPAPYDALDDDSQVKVLRRVALLAADAYGLAVERLEPVLHGFNTTFRVDTASGGPLALRVNTNSVSTREHVAAQQAWVHAIARDTDVLVPDVVTAPDGSAVVEVPCPELGRALLCVVNTWLDGPDVGECDEVQAHALGRVMATLHQHAREVVLPAGAALPVFDEPLFGDDNRLDGTDLLDSRGQEVLAESFARTRAAFAALTELDRPVPLHADLHGGNLKWNEGRLAVFDFDDAGIGMPIVDLAVATFYLRRGDHALEDSLRAGYAEIAELPPGGEHLEALVASRQLLLANSLLTTSTSRWRAQAVEYLSTTVARLTHWMGSGTFLLDPGGS